MRKILDWLDELAKLAPESSLKLQETAHRLWKPRKMNFYKFQLRKSWNLFMAVGCIIRHRISIGKEIHPRPPVSQTRSTIPSPTALPEWHPPQNTVHEARGEVHGYRLSLRCVQATVCLPTRQVFVLRSSPPTQPLPCL